MPILPGGEWPLLVPFQAGLVPTVSPSHGPDVRAAGEEALAEPAVPGRSWGGATQRPEERDRRWAGRGRLHRPPSWAGLYPTSGLSGPGPLTPTTTHPRTQTLSLPGRTPGAAYFMGCASAGEGVGPLGPAVKVGGGTAILGSTERTHRSLVAILAVTEALERVKQEKGLSGTGGPLAFPEGKRGMAASPVLVRLRPGSAHAPPRPPHTVRRDRPGSSAAAGAPFCPPACSLPVTATSPFRSVGNYRTDCS
ncbi:uncharacterized protein LOC104863847 [Fukomys damarensis]|uniref:uncharacterized protein LOC104863847 n=1 Tax=Fukomys damarensis TaxID=885580 RepID=UPI001455AC6F|nr:uncharacterized protein LOC104863847 [Fukomys damarensis]